jgi:hypothetical protein
VREQNAPAFSQLSVMTFAGWFANQFSGGIMRTSAKLMVTTSLLALLAGCGGGVNDAAITQEIQSKLFASPDAKSASIDISSKDGVVTLSGTVPSDAAHLAAYKIATEAKGVTKVNDQMTVGSAQEANAAPVADAVPAQQLAPKPIVRPLAPSKPAKQIVADQTPQPDVAPPPPPEPAPTPVAAAPPPPPAFVQPTPPPQPVTRTVSVPAGTVLRVQMVDAVDSSVNKTGDMLRASLATPIVIGGDVVVPVGTDVDVRLVDANSAGRFKGRSGVTLQLSRLDFQGRSYDLSSTDYTQQGASEGKKTATKVGGGAALGALIGGLIGGGKGAAIGAGAGAGTGTAASAIGKGDQVKIASETKLDFTLQQDVTITYNPDKNRSSR